MPAEGLPTLTTPYGANMTNLERTTLFGELSGLVSGGAGANRRTALTSKSSDISNSISDTGVIRPGYPDPGADWYYISSTDSTTNLQSTTWNLPVTNFLS